MKPETYLQQVRQRLIDDANVADYRFLRERTTDSDVFIRASIILTDGSQLHVAEFSEIDAQGQLRVITYSFHWMDNDGRLRMRWDNARHYPQLPGFPDHIHEGDEKRVIPGEPMTLFRALDHIIAELNR